MLLTLNFVADWPQPSITLINKNANKPILVFRYCLKKDYYGKDVVFTSVGNHSNHFHNQLSTNYEYI